MLEKEIKILEIDKQAVIDTLVSLGAEKTFGGIVHDVYYDFPDDDTHKMEANNRMFRLRQKGQEHIYTIKRTRKKLKKKEGVM
jgi:adenylate cyclase class IV